MHLATLTLIYLILYGLFAVYDIVTDLIEEGLSWYAYADIILHTLTFLGVVFYHLCVTDSQLQLLWKAVAILIISGHILISIYDRRRIIRREMELSSEHVHQASRYREVFGGEKPSEDKTVLSAKEIRHIDIGASVFTIAFLLPAFVLNLLFAYGASQ